MTTRAPVKSHADSNFTARALAEQRAPHSVLDRHLIEDRQRGSIALDKSDYGALPLFIAAGAVQTVHGAMVGDF
ncbi:hypothetical protein [Porphyrobacter sp. YT40]|uniref:hypothetical protein n=1 Tax=Porphyrobacter sp. YT40 TaxID=2547601 RepID=UPI001141AA0D|nr:hypothetical protein [Porphyrobacter sp. YT40]QDH33891.1 hypothetical protein E2E27_05810 [Porphyrobacter sp. YT40]